MEACNRTGCQQATFCLEDAPKIVHDLNKSVIRSSKRKFVMSQWPFCQFAPDSWLLDNNLQINPTKRHSKSLRSPEAHSHTRCTTTKYRRLKKIEVTGVLDGIEWLELCLIAENLKYFVIFLALLFEKERWQNWTYNLIKNFRPFLRHYRAMDNRKVINNSKVIEKLL